MTTVRNILERARAAGERLPAPEAATLFASAVRMAVEQGIVPRPHQLRLEDQGGLSFARDDSGPPAPEYLAPELSANDPPRRTEPRVLVYAAGALGYELLSTRSPPVPPAAPGPELAGPLADTVRLALSPDRRERFGDLQQLLDAVEVVQPRRPPEVERQVLAALLRRARGWGGPRTPVPEGDQVRMLSVRVDVLEAALQQLRVQHETVLKKLAAAAQQVGARRHSDPPHEARTQVLDGGPEDEPSDDWEPEGSREGGPSLGRVFAVAAFASLLVLGAAGVAAYSLRGVLVSVATRSFGAPPRAPSPGGPSPAGVDSRPGPAASASGAALSPPVQLPSIASASPAGSPPASSSPAGGSPAGSLAGPTPASGAAGADAGAGATPDAGAPTTQEALSLAVARSQVDRGRQALAQGKSGEAIASFRAALTNQPDFPDALRGLGRAHALQGKEAEARADYERYLELSPQGPEADEVRRALGELKARRTPR